MNCSDIDKYINGYIEKTLSSSEIIALNEHLSQCEDCQLIMQQYEALDNLFNSGDLIEPPETLAIEIQSMIAKVSEVNKKEKKNSTTNYSLKKGILQIAASFLLFLGGYYFGFYQNNNATRRVLNDLSSENTSIKKSLTLALIDNKSASKRVKAINLTSEISTTSNQVINALIKRMNYDENINVRLAAIEALGQNSKLPVIKNSFIQRLKKENTPEIQIGIIQALKNVKDKNVVRAMQDLMEEKDVSPIVKKYIKFELSNTI